MKYYEYMRKCFLFVIFFVLLFLSVHVVPVKAYVSPSLNLEETMSYASFWGFAPQFCDINGDGNDDLIASNWRISSAKGIIYIHFGDVTGGYSSIPNATISGETDSDYLSGAEYGGNAVATGDLNNDGYCDIFAGALGNTQGGGNFAGKLYVFYGRSDFSGDMLASSDADLSGLGNLEEKWFMGYTVAIADMNNDGADDLIAGAATANLATEHKLYVFLNDGGTFDLMNADAEVTGLNLGIYASLITGDFNGDGNTDVLEASDKTFADIFLGSSRGSLVHSTRINAVGGESIDFARYDSARAYDINKDGIDDICFGANKDSSENSNQGRMYCFFGRSNFNSTYLANEADIIINGESAGDNFGRSAYFYDVTGDGNKDLLVGAYQKDAGTGSRHGRIYVYRWKNGTMETTPWQSITKATGDAHYGISVWADDRNGNGWANVGVTQAFAENGAGNSVLYFYEVDHGTPSITLSAIPSNTNEGMLEGVATESNGDYTISGVEWSINNKSTGTWEACSPKDGIFDSENEDFICDFSSVPANSNMKVYVRSFDQNGLYMPSQLYASSNSFAYGNTCLTTRITNIGSISNVPNKLSLFYYFTSQTPLIKGIADAGCLVTFKDGVNTYFTTANSKGRFRISLSDPVLSRGTVRIEYFAKDKSNKVSVTKTLTLVIGEENFPKEYRTYETPEAKIEGGSGIEITEEEVEDYTESLVEIQIVDSNNNVISDAIVVVDGKKYTSNLEGYIYISGDLINNTEIKVDVKGETVFGVVRNRKILLSINDIEEANKVSRFNWWWLLILIGLTVLIYFLYRKKSAIENKTS